MADEWNERTTFKLNTVFRDEDSALVVPTSATYRIDDVESGAAIKADTAIGSLASSVDITIEKTENAILNSANPKELKKATIVFLYGSPEKQGTNEYEWHCKNLQFHP